MTWLRIHRQLDAAVTRAERAVALARAGREAIEETIERTHQEIAELRAGCVDLDLEQLLFEKELRMLLVLRELERFEREVSQPAEELYRVALAKQQAFMSRLVAAKGTPVHRVDEVPR